MSKVYAIVSATTLAALLVATPSAAQEQSRFGVDASEWSSATVPIAGVVIPVGGSGQVNGQFVTGERYGVQVGIRAQERFVGPTMPVTRAKQVGVYQATTGVSDGLGRAKWNYDLHVDLRNAQGIAAGKTLGDYSLVLDSDIGLTLTTPVSTCAFPCDLSALFFLPATVEIFQASLNPVFFSTGFNPMAQDSYSFTFTLTPKTFNGPSITARMRVDVQ